MSNNKQIAKNFIYTFISFGINLCISFFFTPYLINSVGKEAYGFFPLVNSLIGYTTIFTSAISSMAGRFVTTAYYKEDIEGSKGYFNSVFVGYVALSAFFTIVGLVLVFFIENILTVPSGLVRDVKWLFFFAIAAMTIQMATTAYPLGTYVKNKSHLNSVRDTVSNVVRVVSLLLLFYFLSPSIVYMSVSAFLATIVTAAYNIYYKKKLLPEIEINLREYFSWRYLWEVVSSGMWSSLNALSCILSGNVNILFTNIFLDAEQTADYAIAYTIPNLLATISSTIAITFTPNFNILYAKDQTSDLITEVNKSIKLLSFLLAIPVGYCIVNADEIFGIWVPNAVNERILYLSFILLIFTFFGLNANPLYSIFTITNKRKYPSLVLLLVGLLNIASMFILLKTTDMGVYAIALSGTVFMCFRDILFTPTYAAKCIGIPLTTFYPALIKGALATGISAGISWSISTLLPEITVLNFILTFGISAILTMIVGSLLVFSRTERMYFINVIISKLKR